MRTTSPRRAVIVTLAAVLACPAAKKAGAPGGAGK